MNKWIRPSRNLQEGDIVAVLDSQQRGNWPLGRIESVKTDEDGKVRQVNVRQNEKVFLRPLSRLMLLLPVDEWEPFF